MSTPEDAPTDPDKLIRFGTIASVDLAGARCVVDLDDDCQSPPIRWIEVRSGKTRTWSPPSQGEQVLLLCPGGEIGAAVALRGVACDAYPPAGNSLTEIIGQYDDGAVISYDPVAHQLACVLPAGATLHIVAETVEIEGDLQVTGTVTADQDVVASGISLKSHHHLGAQAGTGKTAGPE